MRFVPIRFTPTASTFKGEECGGLNIIVTDRKTLNSVSTGLEIAAALRKIYPNDWQAEKYDRLLVNQAVFDAVIGGDPVAATEKTLQKKNDEFLRRRALYLLYK